MADCVVIDGSYGEGGGQILRTSLSLAAITGRAVEIANIRAGRSRPGLQPQHLAAVHAAAAICGASLEGAVPGSQRLLFEPASKPNAGSYFFDIKTAGAAPLVLQTVFVPLATAGAESEVTIRGGTHVPHAPPADYIDAVYLPALARSGFRGEMEYTAAGFFPRGGGLIQAHIGGTGRLSPLVLQERGALVSLRAYVVTAGLPQHVGERGVATIERFMKGIGRKIEVECVERESPGPGAAVLIAAECQSGMAGFAGLGERGKPMETVVEEPCRQFLEWWKSGATVDEHMADQLVLPLALACGESRWTTPRVTEHLRTVLWTVGHFINVDYEITDSGTQAEIRLSTGV